MGLPLVGIGLMYRHGYFRQRIDASGWQHEYWVETDPDRTPAALIKGDGGKPLCVEVPIGERTIVAQVWRVNVGRVPLLLLDADRPENDLTDRWITSRLYVGDPGVRLGQYALLGIGGVRVLDALGIEPGVVHLNEGHAAMACLELARTASDFESVRQRTVFTTHTPVPAGNDTYPAAQMAEALAGIASEMGVDPDSLVRRGRTHPEESAEPFGVTQFALRSSADRQRRERPPRRGGARDVAGAVAGPAGRRRADHARHQRRPHPDLDRRADARAARPPHRRRLDRPRGRPVDVGAGRPDPRARAVGRPRRPARRADRRRARAVGHGPARPRRHRRLRARGRERARSGHAHDRLREAGRDLQAARPAAARRRPRAGAARPTTSGRCSSSWPARRTRRTTTASGSSSACSR